MKKKLIAILLMALMVLTLQGCGDSDQEAVSDDQKTDNALKIVCTIFPEYDWARVILGDDPSGADLILLTDKGVDLHSYQPSVEDILDISTCDVLIYTGGESEGFIEDALRNKANDDMTEVNLLETLGDAAKEEEVVEGMEAQEEDEEEGPEYDEHVWLSLKNASVLCDAICDAISAQDPENEEYYRENLKAYKEKLASLDEQYSEAIQEASGKTLLFGDRFPFRYLVDDYGLDYYAAFAGCSSETEASFETITFLAKKADELKLNAIMTIEDSDGRIAQAIIDNTVNKGQKILSMNSMQSVSAKEIEDGASYLGSMEDDLEVLKEALN